MLNKVLIIPARMNSSRFPGKVLKKFNLKKGDFPVSENFYDKEVSLPIYPSLKKNQIFKVINNIKNILSSIE